MLKKSTLLYSASRVEQIQDGPMYDATRTDAQKCDQLESDLRVEYLAAVKANTAAKQYYDEVVTRTLPLQQTTAREHEAPVLFQQHLGLLREQKRYATLVGIQDRLQAIPYSRGPEVVEVGSADTEIQAESSTRGHDITALATEVARHIQALELAVVQAHREAKKEHTLLDRAKSLASDSRAAATESRWFALSAVRTELTTWLENGLAKCQEDPSSLVGETHVAVAEVDVDWDGKIDGQYERYLEARSRLIAVTAGLRNPLPEEETEMVDKRQDSEPGFSMSTQSPEARNSVLLIEARALPSMQQQKATQAHLQATNERLQTETATIISMLDRLGNESQLLQAFPILGHSGRFGHAASTFEKKRGESEHEVEVDTSKRLEPWLFAARAADTTSSDTIQKHMQQGSEAMAAVARSLGELRLLKESF